MRHTKVLRAGRGRKFGRDIYVEVGSHEKKSSAQRVAQSFRNNGFNARVVHCKSQPFPWQLFAARPKRR